MLGTEKAVFGLLFLCPIVTYLGKIRDKVNFFFVLKPA